MPAKPDLVMLAPLDAPVVAALEETFTVHDHFKSDDRAAMLAAAAGARFVATDGHVGLPHAIMDALPKLEIAASYGVGIDAVDVPEASTRGIRITNTPEVLNDSAAELTLALMLALARRIPQADRYVRDGRWPEEGNYALTGELTGRKVGILGLGRVGKEIARRLAVFKMHVVYHGRREQPHQPYTFYPDLVDMARDVDWLVVIAPGTAETKHIVDRRVLDALGPEGHLVNVARGSLVDEPALIAALQEGRLGAAALDVFAEEPRVPEAYFGMDNVVLSPHQASATRKTRASMGDLVVQNLRAHLVGKPLLTPVN